MSRFRPKSGFTLIELLVVIAIIAILAAILFPVFAQARKKARQIVCVSNMKQLGLAFLQYEQDYDERAPLVRTAGPNYATPSDFKWIATPSENTWKDLIYPYIKSGGQPYNNGQPYLNHGDGGAFVCPENSATWSDQPPIYWGYPTRSGQQGDETTRFPRSYAVNDDAGVNELGPNSHFWPAPYDNPVGTGSIATLQTPASTIMVAESRIMFPDAHSAYTGYECTTNGIPAGGLSTSCLQTHGGGFVDFIFFDGHVKATRGVQALQQDLWDDYATTGFGPNSQQGDINNANGVKEMNPGI